MYNCKNKNRFTLLLIICTSLSFLIGCVKLRVYAPQKVVVGSQYNNLEAGGNIVVKSSYVRTNSFALQKGSWFGEEIENEGGSIERVIETALLKTPATFVLPGDTLTLEILEFSLISEEYFGNTNTEVVLRVGISRNGNALKPFEFQKTIDSAVSDSMACLSTVSIVGWLIYAPYIGFRGTLTDQLNQLGRLATLGLFQELKTTIHIPKDVTP